MEFSPCIPGDKVLRRSLGFAALVGADLTFKIHANVWQHQSPYLHPSSKGKHPKKMVPVPVIKTRVAVARNVCFVPALPISSPEDMDCDLPLEEDHPELWPRSTKEIGRYNLKLYLEEAPRACGGTIPNLKQMLNSPVVLVDGTVYSDDRIFWFDGILKSATEYPLVYGMTPSPSDSLN